jgi:dipeptidyl aminopeptidase/acylaminoacyl peptidase
MTTFICFSLLVLNSQDPTRLPEPLPRRTTFHDKIVLFGCTWKGHSPGSLILAMRPDGAGLQTVLELPDGQGIRSGRVAPDRQRLAFSISHAGSNRMDAWLLDEKRRSRKLADSARVQAWSPDGTRLACSRGDARQWENFILDIRTGKEQLIPLAKHEIILDWSPDGRWLALMSYPEETFAHPTKGHYALRKIALVKPDGSGRQELKADKLLDNIWPRFSADSKRLVYFQRKHRDGRVLHDAVVYDLGASSAREVLDFNTVFKGNRSFKGEGFPCWSPDATRFCWLVPLQATATSAINMELVFVSPTTGLQKRLNLSEKGIGFASIMDWR